MFAEERRELILKELFDNKKVNVIDLSKKFLVSQVIIRKDLKELENSGLLERTHGGAIEKRKLAHYTSFDDRKIINEKEKHRIAKKAYEVVKDEDVIVLDVSTINLILAKFLYECPKKITIITNSLEIMLILYKSKEMKLIFLGGTFEAQNKVCTGLLTVENIKRFNPTKCFLGTGGVNLEKGFISNYEEVDGEVKREYINSSREVYLLAENQKFYEDALFNFAHLKDIDFIITDKKLGKVQLEKLDEYGIELLLVEKSE